MIAALIIIVALFFLSITGVNLNNIFGGIANNLANTSPLKYNGGTSWTSEGGLAYLSNKNINLNDIPGGTNSNWPTNGIQMINQSTTDVNIPVGNSYITIPPGTNIWFNYAGVPGVSLWGGGSTNLIQNFCSKIGGTLQTASQVDGSTTTCTPPSSANYSYANTKAIMKFP